MKNKLDKMYELMDDRYGDLKWWPAESAFEVIVGAVLTQNTAWRNVEKAIAGLKKGGLMDPAKIVRVTRGRLSALIRPSGYHRLKAERLKETCRFLIDECSGNIKKMKKRRTRELREKLLNVRGIGPETADSILLYALEKPVFVVDAYTRRIFTRHGIITSEDMPYDLLQTLVHNNFPASVKKLNQFHATLVETAKQFCRKKRANCKECPLGKMKGIRL